MVGIIFLIVLLVLATGGRLACSKICPLGFLQELLYKIPFIKKERNLPHDEILRNVKYVVFTLVVIVISLDFLNPEILNNKINTFVFKIVGFSTVFLLSIISFRPFCKYFCPFGVFLGFFNKISPFRYKLKKEKCIKCNLCKKECKMDILPYKDIDSIECIKCGKCLKKCPKNAFDRKVFNQEIKNNIKKK